MRKGLTMSMTKCSCCKREFSMFSFDRSKYVYKIKAGKKYIYQCSYNCYKREKEKYENKRNSS